VDSPTAGTTVKDAQRGTKHEAFSQTSISLKSGEFITVQYTVVWVGIIGGTNWQENWQINIALQGEINYAV
jgi:hypothetical protein